MFFFKKNTPLLSDLIPDDYIDIHSHLLPGIDDGSKDIEETQHLISSLKAIGFAAFITTPHVYYGVWDNSTDGILSTLEKTNAQLDDTVLNAGAEYMMDSYFFDRLKKQEPLLTLKENYLLVEMSYLSAPIQLYDIIFEIQLQGYKPVLAHPERYLYYASNFDELLKLKKSGCLFQLNLLSTTGYYGTAVSKITQKLLDQNLYDFVGSDVHHQKHVNALNTKVQIKNHSSLHPIIQNNQFFKRPFL
jgi:protein-tyrosine phosphatase